MTAQPLPLDDPQAREPAVAGAKAAGLAGLVAAGFDVPEGVVLPPKLLATWTDGAAPGPVRAAVEAACARLGPRLAVRSSATWEDGATSAHAGATATVLDVSGVDAVLDAVRHCLDAGAAARQSHGASGTLAILVQRLVDADYAGVAFTADPLTGERDVVRVAATKGLGEALVQGEVVGTDVTVRGDEVDGNLNGFSPDAARQVAGLARKVEHALGAPQDIEWAISDDRVWLLQARPITVLPVEPRRPQGNNWQKNVTHFPEPVTPFAWSLMHGVSPEVRSVFDDMGLLVRGLEEEFAGGEIYGRVLPAFGSADAAGKAPPAIVLGIAARLVPELRRRTAAARRAIEAGLPERWEREWHATDRDEMVRQVAELAAVDLAALDDAALDAHLDRCLALAAHGALIHFRLMIPLFLNLYRLHRLVADELGWDDATIAGMFAGHSPASRHSEAAMQELRDRVDSTSGARDALEADPDDPVGALRGIDGALADALSDWIDEHGWAMVNYDPGVPVLAERPRMVTQLVLRTPPQQDEDERDAANRLAARAREAIAPARRAAFDDALASARAIYPVREDNTIIVGDRPQALLRRWMLEAAARLAARGVIPSQADGAYLTVDELRAAVTGGATGGLTAVIVKRRGEEAWVRANPGPLYIGKQAPPPDISRLPEPLRRVNEPIMWAISHEFPQPVEATADADVLLAGVAAAAGVAEGTVRVIRGYEEMGRLEPGDVLVCQVTSPSWAPLFPLAAAVVADGGGALSHAAIAAREHGLPAVLGTSTATSALQDGQRVRVDGTRGLVLAVD